LLLWYGLYRPILVIIFYNNTSLVAHNACWIPKLSQNTTSIASDYTACLSFPSVWFIARIPRAVIHCSGEFHTLILKSMISDLHSSPFYFVLDEGLIEKLPEKLRWQINISRYLFKNFLFKNQRIKYILVCIN